MRPTTGTAPIDMEIYTDDTEDDLRPPSLSKYAQSLLEGSRRGPGDSSRAASPSNSQETVRGQVTQITAGPLPPVAHQTQTNTFSGRRTRHRTPLNLGAPRRLTGEGIDDEGKSTNVFSVSRRSSYTTRSGDENKSKRAMQRTPNHRSTGLSPVVKRQAPPADEEMASPSSSPETPEIGRRALTPLSAQKVNIFNNAATTKEPVEPTFDPFGSPQPRSQKEKTASVSASVSAPAPAPVLVPAPAPVPAKRQPSRESARFKRVLSEELKKQKEQILQEVRTQRQRHEKELESSASFIEVHGDKFEVVEQIGKGGSSKVYRARKPKANGKGFSSTVAIKVVTFDEHDQSTINEFKGEISILQRLHDEDRVVKLIDHVQSPTSLLFIMECGEIDLAHVLSARQGRPFDASFVRYHAVEMLQCVSAVHRAGIVHADLKPANFLFVRGMLKLIDFGISNALTDQTVNVYRECQMGTPNYMAPETLVEADAKNSLWKVGRPADVWSCGCILYQMCYGRPPYASYPGNKKILAITNSKLEITYPRVAPAGGEVSRLAIDAMKKALKRDPADRATAEELIDHPFLAPKVVTERFIGDLVRSAVQYGQKHTEISERRINQLAESVWRRID